MISDEGLMRRLHGISFADPRGLGFVLKDSLTLSQIEKPGMPAEWRSYGSGGRRIPRTSGPATKPGDGDKLVHNGNPFPIAGKRLQRSRSVCKTRKAGQKPNVIWLHLWQIVLMVSVSTTVNISLSVFTVTTKKKRRYQPQKIFLGETSYEGDYRDQRVLHENQLW